MTSHSTAIHEALPPGRLTRSSASPEPGWRTVARLFRPYLRQLLLAQVLFVVKHSPVWLLPLLTADLLNVVSAPARVSAGRIERDLLIALLLVIQNVPSHIAYVKLLSRAVRQVEADLRRELVRRIQQLSFGFLERAPSGVLQSKVMRDVEAVQGLTQTGLTLLTSCGTSLSFALVVTALKQPWLLLLYGVAAPVAAGMARFFRGSLGRHNGAFRKQTEGVSARLLEMIQLLPLTRAHGLEAFELSSLSGSLEALRAEGLRVDAVNATFGAVWWCIARLMDLTCLGVGIYLAWRKLILPGDVVLYTSLFGMMVSATGQIVDAIPTISRGLESARSIQELLDAPELEDHEGKAPVPRVEGEIVLERVSFGYPGNSQPALRNVSLRVKAGETMAVVGPSGSGKSTLMSLIVGFRAPTSGRVLLDGRDMTELDLRTYRQHLAIVPQQTILFSGSVRDNITYGLPEVKESELARIVAKARVDEFLPSLPQGLDTLVGEHGAKLSGGQRQRIAIARALIRNPRIIIFDEATSALDNVSERHVQEAIRELVAGRTTFIIAHRLSTIRDADRIAVMKDGELLEVGSHAELLDKGQEYAKLHAAAEAPLSA